MCNSLLFASYILALWHDYILLVDMLVYSSQYSSMNKWMLKSPEKLCMYPSMFCSVYLSHACCSPVQLLQSCSALNQQMGYYCWQLTSQIITFEHEGNWSKALEYYDLQVRSKAMVVDDKCSRTVLAETLPSTAHPSSSTFDSVTRLGKPYKGIVRSLQKTGCSHVLDLYFHGLTSRRGQFQYDEELNELQV